jgi:cellulose synthase/poly-beta-1,6-N-acetylglucosamine synthase-like glycosyltransferase
MHDWFLLALQLIYGICALGLASYSLHAAWLVWQARRSKATPAAPLPRQWPVVTIQLPIYNERHVIERLIDACARQDYPPECLQIQVLDDSDDETRYLVDRRCAYWQRAGRRIEVVRRTGRSGFKAGALAHALPLVEGELIAIFDADFQPAPDFLRRMVPHLLAPGAEDVGFVQARWGHLNRDYSPITRSQALALDGHFAIEQDGRQAAGCMIGFNGSGGIWRRACIEDPAVGGWHQDTLCEDLDLSYRAQLAGWRPLYLNDIVAPAEVPPQLNAYKRQQFRWAKGSMQTLRKLGARTAASDLPLYVRVSAFVHLGNYLIHPMLLMLLLVIPPILLLGASPISPVPLIGMTSFGPPLLYAAGQIRLQRDGWWRRWAYLPLLTLLGMGVCLNNTVAVWQGWRSTGGEFKRTPKFHVQQSGDRWRGSTYRLPLDRMMLGEIFMAVYAIFAAALLAQREGWLSVPFMLLYAASFGAVVAAGIWQNRPQHPRRAARGSDDGATASPDFELAGRLPAPSPLAVHAPTPEVLVKTTIAQVE